MNTNLPAYGVIALALGSLAAIVALALKGDISGGDALSGIFALLALFGVGAGAAAVNAGVKSGSVGAQAMLQASLDASARNQVAMIQSHERLIQKLAA